MSSILYTWAARWGVPFVALKDLEAQFGMHGQAEAPATPAQGTGENLAQANIRYEATRYGVRLWRNNVGALRDERGVPVRYGLANDTVALNKSIKSADLIGIRPVTITPAHVGTVLGQFYSREVKAPGWSWGNTEREQAQLRWAQLINGLGGNAAFVTGPGSF